MTKSKYLSKMKKKLVVLTKTGFKVTEQEFILNTYITRFIEDYYVVNTSTPLEASIVTALGRFAKTV